MNKKEKILSICLTISMLLVITSALYTIITNKPQNHSFNIEKLYLNAKFNFLYNKAIKN